MAFNEKEVGEFYDFLNHEKETELRLIHPYKKKSNGTSQVLEIFVKNKQEFIENCKKHNGEYLIYAGIHERKTQGISAKHVISMQTIILDIDAKRKQGYEKKPATEEELRQAKKICDNILKSIGETTQPKPVVIHTGNGYQIWFAIPKITVDDNNRESLNKKSQAFQEIIQDRFDIDGAIDNIGDLPRIIKVWGTQNIKGKTEEWKETEERPFRTAKIISEQRKREENQTLWATIIDLDITEENRETETYEEFSPTDSIDLNKLPPCVDYLLKYYENSNPNYWFRIVQYLAAFFRTTGLQKKETEHIIQEWNKKQPYHEPGETSDIKQHITRIYDKGLNVANCEKVKKDKGGFPYTGLSELKICKPDKECKGCKNPIICWKKKNKEDKIGLAYGLMVTNYKDNAQRFHEIQPYFYDKTKIFWFWNKTACKWEIVDETDVMNAIDDNLKLGGETISSHIKCNYLEAFKRVGRKKQPIKPDDKFIQFKNKIVNIQTEETEMATPRYFFCNPIPWELGDSEETPTMDRIFEEWVGKNYAKTLYEIIAYSLITSYPIHRIFCFIGSGLNGKSKFLQLLTKFIGEENAGTADLHRLSKGKFETTKIYKKLVALIGETDFSELNDTNFIKRLTGQDRIGYEFKNKDGFDDHNYAKILLATNNLPTTNDKTDGFYRRWLIIDFYNTFDEKKEILEDIPEVEYNNLARKSIRMLRDLLVKREFHKEGGIKLRKQRYEEKSNPFDKFWNDNVEDGGVEDYISKKEFKKRMDQWCVENRFRIMSEITINKHVCDKNVYEKMAEFRTFDKDLGDYRRVQFKAWSNIRWRGGGL